MTDHKDNLLQKNKDYWSNRVSGYSEVNQEELATSQHKKWKKHLCHEIISCFPDRDPSGMKVLDIGTGPGFFSILLAESGFSVTAIDLTPEMLAEAQINAIRSGLSADSIRFLEMNAENLRFGDGIFDVVISRNLTWNLPHPERAYAEWTRVLKPGGLLLNFDANWYHYLVDEKARSAYEADRENTKEAGMNDQNVGENFDAMEEIAAKVPLTKIYRPTWDIQILTELGMQAEADENVWTKVWSEEEKMNFFSTPLFMIRATKPRKVHHG